MGRKSKREGIYVYIELIHFAVQYKLTQHCIAHVYTSIEINFSKDREKASYYLPGNLSLKTNGSSILNKILQWNFSQFSPMDLILLWLDLGSAACFLEVCLHLD